MMSAPSRDGPSFARLWNLLTIGFLAWAAVWATADDGSTASPSKQPPKPTSLIETVEKRLVQLDVGVEGDPEAIRAITAKDFALYVGEHEVSGLIVDHLCGEAPSPEPEAKDAPPGEAPPIVVPKVIRPRATFIFFFDQNHLTMAGRTLSLATSRDLINRLVVDGSRASIVSNADRVETIVAMTGDREKLLAGLERVRNDPRQWESYAETERKRKIETIGHCQLAKVYAREEWFEARQSTERIGYTVGALAELPAPKALVYFGDNLRQKAGLHYLHGACVSKDDPANRIGRTSAPGFDEVTGAEIIPSAAVEFDAVINEALARGVHFFTIQAEGLLAYTPGWDTERHHQAQDALVGLAVETGGEAFLGGASNTYIADRIAKLTSCRLLLSFPPGDLPRDRGLNVTLELHVPKVKIQTQGRIVVPSQASIERARLLAAFVDPESSDDGSLRVLLVPRGGDGKTWNASVQLRLRPTGFPDNSVELGASIVRRNTVQDRFAASIATKSGTRAMVVEQSIDIAPGAFSVVAVARDVKRGDVASNRLEADWPNLAKCEAAIAPIAALQSTVAAISKDGILHSTGSLAREVDELLDPSASVVLTSVVCRGTKTTAPVVIERWIDGGAPDEFDPMTIAEPDSPCLQTVDAVPPGRLPPGVVDYRVVARIGDEIVAQERRTLRVGAAAGVR
jgi:hypothetical protein